MSHPEIERATDELRQLVGRGVTPVRIVTKPTLLSWSKCDQPGEDLTPQQLGNMVVGWLTDNIRTLEGEFVLRGVQVDASLMRRCLLLLLKLEGRDKTADNRRALVLRLLKLDAALSQMRRPWSPEREMLGLLAQHLWACSHESGS
jgi:hypothetical protein